MDEIKLGVESGYNGEKEDIALIHPTKKLNPLDMCYPISVKTAYVGRKGVVPKKNSKITLVSINC